MNGITYAGVIVVFTILYDSVISSDPGGESYRIFNESFSTSESSTRKDYISASPAFDGEIGPEPGDPESAVCSHTEEENEPWWYVDLSDIYIIDYVVVYNRNQNSGRLTGAQVRVGTNATNLKNNRACGQPVSESTLFINKQNITINCSEHTIGNIVSVQLENKRDFLTLCEVAIYGKKVEYMTTNGPTTIQTTGSPTTEEISTTMLMKTTAMTTTVMKTTKNDTLTLSEQLEDWLDKVLTEGEIFTVSFNELRGFVARLHRNGTLSKQTITGEEEEQVSVALQIEAEQDPKTCIALFGRSKRYSNLTYIAKKQGLDNSTSAVDIGTDVFQSYIFDGNRNEIAAGINIKFTFPTTTNRYREYRDKQQKSATCAFFNETLSKWSTAGCETKERGNNVECTCNHTTSYAILFQVTGESPDEKHVERLSVITYIGLSISTAFLIGALITQNILPDLRKSMRFKILTHLIIAAILSNVVFLTIDFVKEEKIICAIYAGILHYTLLVIFAWMMIFSADLYAKVFYSFANHHKRLQWSRFVGWGLPFIVVLVTVSATELNNKDDSGYVSSDYCWLGYESGAVWGFVGPAVFAVLINIVLITRVLIEVSKKSRGADVTQKRKLDDLKYVAIRATLLLPVIGITWVSGFFVLLFREEVVFNYVFVVANSCQGVLIWLTQFFWSREVKNAWTSMRKKKGVKFPKVSFKRRSKLGEFTGIGEFPVSPPNSTMDNANSLSSKKSLTQTSEINLDSKTTYY